MPAKSRSSRRRAGIARIKLVIILMIAAALGFAYFVRPHRSSHDGILYYTASGGRIKVIEFSPARYTLRPEMAKVNSDDGESFAAIVERLKPCSAINGTFYGTDMKPLGDIVADGKVQMRGAYRNAIAVTRGGHAVMLHRERGQKFPWSSYYSGLGAGPRLVHRGKVSLDPVADGFSRSSLKLSAWRSGVAIKPDGKVMLVSAAESITLGEFAKLMAELKAEEALNLDGGGACALYHDGRVLVSPTLPMTNVLGVFEKKTGR